MTAPATVAARTPVEQLSVENFLNARHQYQIPANYFESASPPETRRNHLNNLESAIVGELLACFTIVRSPDAREHLRGCSRRAMMMQSACLDIEQETNGRIESLDPFIASHLNLCLNAFYTNLTGALDNLAWAATFELLLIPQPDGANPVSRRFCGLTSSAFRRALAAVRPFAASLLDGVLPWVREVKDFRDPAAHRIPLAFVTGMLPSDREAEYSYLHRQALDALGGGDWMRHASLKHQAKMLEHFLPLLETPRPDQGGFYSVPELIAGDQRKFLDFVHAFLPLFVDPIAP